VNLNTLITVFLGLLPPPPPTLLGGLLYIKHADAISTNGVRVWAHRKHKNSTDVHARAEKGLQVVHRLHTCLLLVAP
jgi:hypothetical protein